MYTVVALGNPGEKYNHTRHNAGRILLVEALRDRGWSDLSLDSRIVDKEVAGNSMKVLLPDTYMNESGKAVVKMVGSEASDHLIVVYDDIDLPLGELKISFGRGSGGHNGLASIISALGTKNFTRIRVGIARRNFWGKLVRPEGDKLGDYVLGRLSRGELEKLLGLKEKLASILETIVVDGRSSAMTRFN
ncbi:MAG: aminoacyl-tRNA hydrolase [Candidatus Paceibacterota bacterium]